MDREANEDQASYTVIVYQGGDIPHRYQSLVYSKWMRSLRYGNDYYRLIDKDAYFSTYEKIITALLHNRSAVLRLAVLSDDRDVVLGWSIVRTRTILDYVHVQKDFRKKGIATALVPKDVDTITHATHVAISIWASKFPKWRLNPYA
jgi:GNAT superfamily N-acetyltransferase